MQAIDIFTPEGSSLESGTSLLGGQKEEKNGPSLFDSILKSSIDSKNLNSTGEEVISDSLKVANTMENNLTTTSGMGSLLDKLIISAKETISQNGAETISNEISSDQLDNVDLKDKTKFVDTLKNIIQTNSTVSVDESVIESEVNVVEAETSTSLLDKLVSDAKKDIFDSDVVKTNLIETTSNQNVESEVNVVEAETSTSLLDKLVSDAKKDIFDSDVGIVTRTCAYTNHTILAEA